MRPYVLLYVTDVARSQAWYERLGFAPRRQGRHGTWAELLWTGSEGEGFLLYLHGNPEARPAGFALPGFEVSGPLEDVAARLALLSCGETPAIVDEGFGRTLNLRDPDGYEWQLVEHEPELYA